MIRIERRGCARKIGKGSGIFGFHAEPEFEIWGWVLPGSHPRNSPPERLWERKRLRSRNGSHGAQRPASPDPCPREGERGHPTYTEGRGHRHAGRTGQVRHPPPQRMWGSPVALLFCMFPCPDLCGSHLLRGLSDSSVSDSSRVSSCPTAMTTPRVPPALDAAMCKQASAFVCCSMNVMLRLQASTKHEPAARQ